MKIPISKRLECCGQMVAPGAAVADIGTDHGYLPIWLICNGICSTVYAADLRQKPLEKAQENARIFGVAEQIHFRLSDGLERFDGSEADTIVCAGMGGDLIIHILSAAKWLRQEQYTLILQPQSSGQDLRRWLGTNGFGIIQERLLQEGGFFYTVMAAKFGQPMHLSPGQQFLSPWLLADRSPLLPRQMERLIDSLEKTVSGISACRTAIDQEKLTYYKTALKELQEMRAQYDNGT